MNIGARFRTLLKASRHVANARALLLCGSALLAAQQPAHAVATLLADQPIFTYSAVPGNLLLSLSVEFPTAISVANSGAYVNTTTYLGIFDATKCYLYNFNAQTYTLTGINDPYNYFYPTKYAAANNNCGGTAADPEWSGNYLNWVGMQTIDPFRTALTGGYRSLDADGAGGANQVIQTGDSNVGTNGAVTLTAGLTVLEKAWASNQGSASSNFPDRFASKASVSGITPLSAVTASWSTIGTRIWNAGNVMYFDISNNSSGTIQTAIDGGTTSNATPYNPANIATMSTDTVYSFKIRAQVCAGGATNGNGLNETNCQPYSTWAKPEGLLQQYNQKIRYGAFGYLNEAGTALDGGVLRARMNFVGPMRPIVNSTPIDNTPVNYGGAAANNGTAEWDGTTGVYYQEPDLIDETATNKYFTNSGGTPCPTQSYTTGLGGMTAFNTLGTGACAYNSGTLNYLNKFGETSHSYKTDDPVSELYYASVRYFRWFNGNTTTISGTAIAAPVLDAVPEYDLRSNSGSTNFTWVDGFPVIGACGSPGGQNSCTNAWSRGRYQALTTTTPGTPVTASGYTCGASPVSGDTCLGVDLDDPIQYACQKNFILGIGDIHTHADGDLPGGGPYASEEPSTQPPAVTNDTTMNFTVPATATTTYAAPGVSTIINIQTGTDMVAALENLETKANTPPSGGDNDTTSPYHGAALACLNTPNFNTGATGCSSPYTTSSTHFKYLVAGGDQSTYFMAGEAYDAHTRDIRPHEFLDSTGTTKNAGIQTISSYWLDVLESQDYKWRNQFWLTAKFGGFALPTSGWNTYGSTTPINNVIQGPLSLASWNANGNTDIGFPGVTTAAQAHPLPDHYYNASQASLMVSGLTSAFKSISNALQAFTTSFSLAQPTVTATNNVAYSSDYNAQYWSGTVLGAAITGFDTNNNPIYGTTWDGGALLAAAIPSSRSIVTCCSTTAVGPGVEFSDPMMTANAATEYALLGSTPLGATPKQMLTWLRGDHSQEVNNGGLLRNRTGFVLGDIVNSAVVGVAPPSAFYSDSSNPGYSNFKNKCATRSQMAYVGANDGMLHAFNGTVGQALSGQEIFAYIPSPTFNGPTNPATDGLQALANPTFVHHYYVDSTPTITDIYIAGSTSTCPGGSAGGWQSLLVSGMGKGGKSYFAIDVTNPDAMSTQSVAAANVKWEFTDPTMGFTFGEPVVVKTKKYGWVVIVTSGYDNSDGNGYFYFIDPATGALKERVKVGTDPYNGGTYANFTPSTSNPVGMGPATAFVNDYTDYTADAVYAGDLQGHVWRIDMSSTVAATPGCVSPNCTPAYAPPVMLLQTSTARGSGNPQPITQRVLTEIQPSSNARRILVGTGSLLSTADIASTDVQSIYSIVDGISSPGRFFTNVSPNLPPSGVVFPVVKTNLAADTLATGVVAGDLTTYPEGFYVDLPLASSGSAYRVNVPMAEDQGELAVVANAPVGDACDPSGTHIDYALDIGNGQSYVQTSSTNTTLLNYYTPPAGSGEGTGASFVQDGTGSSHPYFCNSLGGCEQPPGKTPPGTGLTRVNWREIPSPE
jgi:type IV pilus assembly protein PilY1